jgi:hypothetical protein
LQPLQRPRVKIDPAAASDNQKQELKANVTKWRSSLSPAVQRYFYPTQDPTLPPLPDVTDEFLCEMHSELTKLLVNIPGSVFETHSTNTQSKVYKTPVVQRYFYPTQDPTLPPLPDVTDEFLCEMHSELTKLGQHSRLGLRDRFDQYSIQGP